MDWGILAGGVITVCWATWVAIAAGYEREIDRYIRMLKED